MRLTSILIAMMLVASPCLEVSAQDEDPSAHGSWNHDLEAYMYFMPDDFIFLPIYQADKGWLHLEARYNYEDMNTFSAWFGYNIRGGKKFTYDITPMLGGIAGNSNGLGFGLEFTLNYAGFELYSESEHVFDLEYIEDDFFYNWSDLTYAPLDWLWFGISTQRTKLYETKLEVQRGLLVGWGYKWFELSAYLYNLGFDDPYFIVSLSFSYPE